MTPTLKQIRKAVANHFEITEADLTGPSRQSVFAHPRMLAYKISRKTTDASLPQIGRTYGGRDHSTVRSGITSISDRRDYQDKMGSGSLTADTAAIIAEAQRLAILEDGGVFHSQRGESPLFVSTRNTKEIT